MLLSILSSTLISLSYIVKTKNKSFPSKPTFDCVCEVFLQHENAMFRNRLTIQ